MSFTSTFSILAGMCTVIRMEIPLAPPDVNVGKKDLFEGDDGSNPKTKTKVGDIVRAPFLGSEQVRFPKHPVASHSEREGEDYPSPSGEYCFSPSWG